MRVLFFSWGSLVSLCGAFIVLLPSCGTRIQTPLPDKHKEARIEQLIPIAREGNQMFTGRMVALTYDPNNLNLIYAASESGGIFRSRNSGLNWEWVKEFPCFRICDIKFHPTKPGLIFCTTYNDLKRENGGGIWYSTDGGEHWIKTVYQNYTPSADHSGFEIAFLGNTTYFGTSNGIVFYDVNGGVFNFNLVSSRIIFSLFPFSRQKIFFKSLINYGYMDQAGTVTLLTGPGLEYADETRNTKSVFALNPFDPNVIYTIGKQNKILKITTSENVIEVFGELPSDLPFVNSTQGRPKFIKTIITQNTEIRSFDMYFSNGQRLYVSSYSYLAGALTQSVNWREVRLAHVDPSDILFDEVLKRPKLIAGDGGLMYSLDNGNNFNGIVTVDKGINALQVYDISGRYLNHSGGNVEKQIYWGTQDNGIWSGINPYNSWKNFGVEGGFFSMLPFPNGQKEWTFAYKDLGSGKVVKCDNNIDNYPQFPFPSSAHNSPTGHQVPIVFTGGNYFAIFENEGQIKPHIFISDIRRWIPYATAAFTNPTVNDKIQSSGNEDPVFIVPEIASQSGLLGNPSYQLNRISGSALFPIIGVVPGSGVMNGEGVYAINPLNPEHIILTDCVNNKVIYTNDNGLSWHDDISLTNLITENDSKVFGRWMENASTNGVGVPVYLNLRCIKFNPRNPNIIWAGTMESGAFVSGDGGKKWEYIPDSKNFPDIRSFYIESDNTAYAASYGRGVFKISLGNFKPQSTPIVDYGPWISLTNGVRVRLRDLADPELCPQCQYIEVKNGYFTSIMIDKNDKVENAAINGGSLSAFSPGKPNYNIDLKFVSLSEKEMFEPNSWVAKQLTEGSVITTIILDNGYLKGVITSSKVSISKKQ